MLCGVSLFYIIMYILNIITFCINHNSLKIQNIIIWNFTEKST